MPDFRFLWELMALVETVALEMAVHLFVHSVMDPVVVVELFALFQ